MEKIKKSVKKKVIMFLIPVALVGIAAIGAFAAFDAVGTKVEETIAKVGETIKTGAEKVKGFFTVNKNDEDKENLGKITITDEQADEIINAMEEIGIDVDDLQLMGDDADYNDPKIQKKNQEALRKYVKKFYAAQATTETIYLQENFFKEWFKNEDNYGTVFLYRVNGDKDKGKQEISKDNPGEKLKYANYDKMEKWAENGNLDKIRQYYSLDENDKLVIPYWTTITQGNKPTTKITLKKINYKSAISQYTTAMNFFFYLATVSRNPEFVSAVADLVKTGEIHITVLENKNEIEEVGKYYQTLNEWAGKHPVYDSETGELLRIEEAKRPKPNPKATNQGPTTTTTTTTSISTQLKIIYVKTWFCEQSISYIKEEQTPSVSDYLYDATNDSDLQDDPTPPEPEYDQEVTWYTNKRKEVTITRNGYKYKEATRSKVEDKTGEKGDQGVLDKNNNGKVDKGEFINENSTFIGLIDDNFQIPNTNIFQSAGNENLVSGAEILFHLMQKDARLQKLEQLMRYIMFKYTGNDYGVTEFDFQIFNAKEFADYTGGVVGNSAEEKVWYSLRNMGFSEYAVAGVMGNIYGESNFNPSLVEAGSGEGIGLCQWSFDRRHALEGYAESRGKTWEDVNIQVQFLMGELTEGGGADGFATYNLITNHGYSVSSWTDATSPSDAAVAFCWIFERPGVPRLEVRTEAAERYYEMFQGKTLEFADDYITSGQYTFPHYLQGNFDHRFGSSTIASSGCGPTSLAMILSGLLDDPTITPISLVENLEEYFPDYRTYYWPGAGTVYAGLLDNGFLSKYYGVSSRSVSTSTGIVEVENGKVAIGRCEGHVLAIVPVSEEYRAQGYRFFVLDSAKGLDGPYRSASEVAAQPRSGGIFEILYVID